MVRRLVPDPVTAWRIRGFNHFGHIVLISNTCKMIHGATQHGKADMDEFSNIWGGKIKGGTSLGVHGDEGWVRRGYCTT